MNHPNCTFCRILRAEAPASIVFEDELCMAFMDLQPVNPGHVLIVPKEHVAYFKDMDEDLGAHLFRIGLRIDRALRETDLRCEGVNFFAADGKAAFQEIFHAHLHVFPRYRGDGFRLSFREDYLKPVPRIELDQIALEISRKL
jgi:histidine triad (HIT) family protein